MMIFGPKRRKIGDFRLNLVDRVHLDGHTDQSFFEFTNPQYAFEGDESRIFRGDYKTKDDSRERICLRQYVREHTYAGFRSGEGGIPFQWLPVAGFSMVLASDPKIRAKEDTDVSEFHLYIDLLASRLFPHLFPNTYFGMHFNDPRQGHVLAKVSDWRPSQSNNPKKSDFYSGKISIDKFDREIRKIHGDKIDEGVSTIKKAGMFVGHPEVNFGIDKKGLFFYEAWQQINYADAYRYIQEKADLGGFSLLRKIIAKNGIYNVRRHLEGLPKRDIKEIKLDGVDYKRAMMQLTTELNSSVFFDRIVNLNTSPRLDMVFESIEKGKKEVLRRIDQEFPEDKLPVLGLQEIIEKVCRCCCIPLENK